VGDDRIIRTPPNSVFEVGDYNVSNWGLTPTYDLIHGRELLGSVLYWPNFVAEVFKGLKPRGWIECVEPDIDVTSNHVRLPEDDLNQQWVSLF
jgi:hypothetical protein